MTDHDGDEVLSLPVYVTTQEGEGWHASAYYLDYSDGTRQGPFLMARQTATDGEVAYVQQAFSEALLAHEHPQVNALVGEDIGGQLARMMAAAGRTPVGAPHWSDVGPALLWATIIKKNAATAEEEE